MVTKLELVRLLILYRSIDVLFTRVVSLRKFEGRPVKVTDVKYLRPDTGAVTVVRTW